MDALPKSARSGKAAKPAPATAPVAAPEAAGFAAARQLLAEATRPATPPTAPIIARGDLEITAGATVQESVSTEREAIVGRNCDLHGDLHALQGAKIGEGAKVRGELDVAGPVQWGNGASAGAASLRGGLVTEGDQLRARRVKASAGIHPLATHPAREVRA